MERNENKKNERTYWITVTHSYPEATAEKDAARILDYALATGTGKLKKQHRSWWNHYYPSSFLYSAGWNERKLLLDTVVQTCLCHT